MKALEIIEEEGGVLDIFHVVERQPIPYGEYPFAEYPQGWVGENPVSGVQEYPKWAENYNERLVKHTENYFSQALEKVNEKKSEKTVTNLEIATGNPADRILDKIEEGNYDLVVMGSTGLSAIDRFLLEKKQISAKYVQTESRGQSAIDSCLLGSVSNRVKAETETPVKLFNKEGER
jgi:nucleotide-binding universal stress UspA family protein